MAPDFCTRPAILRLRFRSHPSLSKNFCEPVERIALSLESGSFPMISRPALQGVLGFALLAWDHELSAQVAIREPRLPQPELLPSQHKAAEMPRAPYPCPRSCVSSSRDRRFLPRGVAGPAPAAVATKKATATIPIVITLGADPVAFGLMENLSPQVGNVTGLTEVTPELTPKRLALLKEIIPTLSRVTLLWQAGALRKDTIDKTLAEAKATSGALGLEIQLVEARASDALETVFDEIARGQRGCGCAVDELGIQCANQEACRSCQPAQVADRL
jgi:hypothetical protein